MKKNYILLVLFLTAFFSSKLTAQVPNGGFENWHVNYLFSEPLPYFTSNFQAYLALGEGNVLEVPGETNSAVRLETVTDGNEIIPGTIILANIQNGNVNGGYPFTSEPTSISGDFRYDISPADTAALLLFFTWDGFPVNILSIPITGALPNFTYQTFDIPTFLSPPDSVLVLVASSSGESPAAGSWIEIDNLLFDASPEQLPNNGFDDWTDLETEEPEDWSSANYFSVLSNSTIVATKSTDAHTGNFALRLETAEISFFGQNPDTIGYISTGSIGDEGIEGGFPYNDQPDMLTGYYKYTPVGNDTAVVNVSFSKYNSGTGETDSLYEYLVQLPPVSTYTKFEIPISLSEMPDTANLAIGSSNYEEEGNYLGIGSVLLIDDVQFEFIDGTVVPLFYEEVLLYPNPANDYTNLDLNTIKGDVRSIQFFDALGRNALFVEKPEQTGNSLKINTVKLSNGIYWYLIKTDAGDFSGKLLIER